jgi:hypothetical protein
MYKIASILSSAEKKNSASEVYIAQPDSSKEELAGKLFVLAEIETNRINALKIINFLINTLSHNYYQNEKMILRERISTLKVEHIFEIALAKTNKDLIEFLSKEKIKVSPATFNLTTGIIYENDLHFSQVGKNRAFLIFQDITPKPIAKNRLRLRENSDNELNFKISEINKKTKNEYSEFNINKIFSEIISGQIPDNGYFLFANEALPEYLSSRQLIDFITKLPPLSAAEQIKNTLENINSFISISGIIIKNSSVLANEKFRPADKKTERTYSPAITATEEKTEKIMSTGGTSDIKKFLKIPSGIFSRNQTQTENKFFLKDKVFVKRKKAFEFLKKIANAIKGILILLFTFIFKGLVALANREKRDLFFTKVKNTIVSILLAVTRLLEWFKHLKKTQKILIIGAISCLLLFSGGLFYTKIQNNKQEKLAAINDLSIKIEQNQNKIEASLLYNNETEAAKLLNENNLLINDLISKTENDSEALTAFKNKYDEQLDKISHAISIDTPKELANFANLNANAKAESITYFNNQIYSVDNGQKVIYHADLNNNLITTIDFSQLNIPSLDYPSANKTGNQIYYLGLNSLAMLDAKTSIISGTAINLPIPRSQIGSLAGYNNRLYLLDKNGGQIYRFQKQGSGFGDGQKWLDNNNNFKEAVGMAIDGSIYILKNNGQILKFSSGGEESLTLASINPVLQNPTIIKISDEKDFLYILEPKNNRLLVYNKNGKFIMQYKISNLGNLTDFFINETDKKVYILADNKISEFEANHLN